MNALMRFSLAVVSAISLVGCDNTTVDHSAIRKTGFVYCGQGNLTTFNPQLVDSGITVEALSPQLFDTLLVIDPTTLQPRSNIAQSWTVDDSGTEYTFYLRSGVQFHHTSWFTPSRTLNAFDVKFSFDRILNKKHPYHNVSGGSYPWFSGTNFEELVKEVRVVDDNTVTFILRKPDNSFLSNIATPHAAIFSEEYAQTLLQERHPEKLDMMPIGTGPFYLDEFQANDFIRLKRNEFYWQTPAKLQQVVFDISQRGTGTLAKLLLNECDVLSTPISSQIPVIKQQEHIKLSATPAMNVAFIAVNTNHPVLHDANLRKAISLAINRDNILNSVYYGTGSIAYNLLPPSSWAYQIESSQIRFDRHYAMRLIESSGLKDSLHLTMLVPLEPTAYNPSPRKTAELIQANLKDVGINLTIVPEEKIDRQNRAKRDDVDLFLTGWTGRTGDPDSFLRPVLSCHARTQGINLSKWCNQDFDSLLDLALEANKQRYRKNLYHQAQNIVYQQFPVIPLAHGMQFRAYNTSLEGLGSNPFHVQPFTNVDRVEE